MQTLIQKLRGVWEWRWNLDHFILFQTVIMQRAHHVSGAQANLKWIVKRLDMWELGKYHMMVQEMVHT